MKQPETPRPTIRDVARRAGVSVATVSRVMNGHPDVSDATREAVLQQIREDNYVTSRGARGLAGGRTGLIALTVPFMHPEYFAQIVEGAAEALYERDARFVLCPTAHEHDREVSLLGRVMHGTTDGAVLILPSESNDELVRLQQHGYPFIVVDPSVPLDPDIPTVAAANWSGARTATEHLLALGHRRITAISGPANWSASMDRVAGYHSALMAAGVPPGAEQVVEADFTVEGGYRVAKELLQTADPPTAVFALNDNMATGVLQAAKDLGYEVPEELSIVGFDDIALASISSPALTTVRQPLLEMGRMAASLLGRLIDGQPLEATRLELSTRLVVRESTAKPRQVMGQSGAEKAS